MSEESYRLMTQRAIATHQWGGAWYGYGLTMADIDGHVYLGHGGSTTGFVAAMIADLDDGIGLVVLIKRHRRVIRCRSHGPSIALDIADGN